MMNTNSYISDEDINDALSQSRSAASNEKQKWVQRMIKSAKHHHKICPYYDKKTGMCFLQLGGKCDREGRYENCPVFREFLEKKYDEYKKKGMPLPVDFTDIVIMPF